MPHLQPYRQALQKLQSHRLRRDHADLAAESQYRLIAEFFFEEVYGPRDFHSRDQQAHRLHQFVNLAPGLNIGDVDQALELLQLTTQLDELVVDMLYMIGAAHDFDESSYERAYRQVDNFDERVRQIELVRAALYNVHRLARKHLLGIALERTNSFARAVGMADIHRFLLNGYQAIQPVRDIYRFVETICVREQNRLERIYKLPLERVGRPWEAARTGEAATGGRSNG